jgi:Copper transport outer membrane protein, MctB
VIQRSLVAVCRWSRPPAAPATVQAVFDYRYHALSLAAVLLALAVGILIGVAIGDSNLVSSAKSGIVANLDSEIDGAHHQIGQLQDQLAEQEAFANGLYPLAVHGLLSGRDVGLVFLGASSNEVDGLVRTALAQAGGSLTLVAAVREPLDLRGIGGEAAGTRYATLAGQPALVQRFGELAGRQLVSGGPLVARELLSRVRASLLSAFDGQLSRLQGLVVMRAAPSGMSPEQSEASAAFATGLLNGVAAVGVPTVGVELTKTEPSQVPWYEGKNLSSVDDLDTRAGQAALIYALDGAHGAYGVKPTADSLLPSAVP